MEAYHRFRDGGNALYATSVKRMATFLPYLALGTSAANPSGTDSDGLGAIFWGAIFKMAEVNRTELEAMLFVRPVISGRFVREPGIIVCYLEDLFYQGKSVFKIRERNTMQTPALILYSIG